MSTLSEVERNASGTADHWSAKDYLVKHQITAEGWFVANPDLSLAEIDRLKKVGTAVDEFLEKVG